VCLALASQSGWLLPYLWGCCTQAAVCCPTLLTSADPVPASIPPTHPCLLTVAADAIEASTSRVASELQQGGQRGDGPRVGIIMGSDSDLATMKVRASSLWLTGLSSLWLTGLSSLCVGCCVRMGWACAGGQGKQTSDVSRRLAVSPAAGTEPGQ